MQDGMPSGGHIVSCGSYVSNNVVRGRLQFSIMFAWTQASMFLGDCYCQFGAG